MFSQITIYKMSMEEKIKKGEGKLIIELYVSGIVRKKK